MKNLTLLFCLMLTLPLSGLAGDKSTPKEDPVIEKEIDGEMVDVQPMITGEIGLYRRAFQRKNIDHMGEVTEITWYRFYIGSDKIEEITPKNYRVLIKKHLKDAPELHRKLGRFGFRFVNVPSMIMYYNRFKSDKRMTMNYDLQTTTALLMDTAN